MDPHVFAPLPSLTMAGRRSDPDTSLSELSDQIHAVYRHLLEEGGAPDSAISLDSTDNEPAMRTPRLGHGFPSPFQDGAPTSDRSAPATPLSSSSIDYNSPLNANHRPYTTSSIDLIAENGTPDPAYPHYSPYSDTRKLNQTYSLPDENETLDATPERSSTAIDEEDWAERGAAESVALAHGQNGPATIRRTVKDFDFGKDLGEGSYSTVVLATDRITKTQYAVKVLDKRHIIKEKKVKYVNIEKHALNRLSGLNGIISLFFTFQDKDRLYFVLDYASNGELLGLIKTHGSLNEECTRHFGAQILDGIKNMHDNGIIHRDIKPENILIDDHFRIRITDFGTAKLLERKKNEESGIEEDYPLDVRAKSFVGTAEYVSPELLESKYCGKPGDIWAFGCLLYQLIAGKPPFKATNEYLTFQKITKLQYAFSAGFPLILRDLIKHILVLRPSRRASIGQIQKHPFFEKCNFKDPDLIWNAKVPELTPYKMTAQSMMKMPPKAPQAPKESKIVVKKKAPSLQSKAPNDVKINKLNEDKGARNFTPASVAAYVLAKDDETPSAQESVTSRAPTPQSSLKSNTTSDYIPGTNILRPQVNSMANFSRASTSSSSKSDHDHRKPHPRTKEIPPSTAIEAAWLQYLSTDERVIHVGSVSATKKPTEVFEKKHKGMIHDTPLGFSNQLKSSMQRSNSRSMLSRYVKENQLRDRKDVPHAEKESDAITFFYEEVVVQPESPVEDEDKSSLLGLGHGRFGKFRKFLANDRRNDSFVDTIFENGTVTRQTVSLDKPRACTVLITTFGRVLMFLRDDVHSDYKLICEVKLRYPFIQFKEVITSPSTKFGKHIPASGIFAIVSKHITFVFEVEKYEVGQWTEALARAKLCLIERDSENDSKASQKSPVNVELLDSPRFTTTQSRQRQHSNKLSSNGVAVAEQESASPPPPPPPTSHNVVKSPSQPRTLDPKNSSSSHMLAQKRIRAKEALKRKAPPPPPIRSPHLELTGLLKDPENGEKATVHAAQLAVLNIHLSPKTRGNEVRTSSFTKETTRSRNIHSAVSGSITPMNSKLLARSRSGK